MNKRIIFYILGWIMLIEAGLLLPPFLIGVIYHEQSGWWFLLIAILEALCGLPFMQHKPKNMAFSIKEACIATAFSWIIMSLIGALPFYFSGEIPHYIDALFETISGFTTTGASILSDVEALSHSMLFWRSFTHWIGGMGVLVFMLAIVQMTGGYNMNLMRAESPGPSVGKIAPKLKNTARLLYLLYFALTLLQFILLLIGKMPWFDAITTAFGTAGTGGFGIKNSSLGDYSPYIQWVTAIFMILFGVNFNAYSLLLFRKWRQALQIEEIRYYFVIIAVSTLIITFNLYDKASGLFTHFRDALFQVASIITTTGFSTTDFNEWPQLSRAILVMLMFVGACAGSTGGGIKVSRFVIGIKTVVKELGFYIHPKSVKKIKMDDHPVDHEVLRGVNVYFITFFSLFTFSFLLICLEGKDLVTNFTAVAATINNIGPGLNLVGPTENFGGFSAFSKLVLMFDMLAGRLELFPMLLLFHPACWKGLFSKNKT